MAENKKRYELKIGILALTALVALFLGFNFFKGKNLFGSTNDYYSYYDNVEGVSTAAKVMVNGYQVGKVSNVEMLDNGKFKVTMTLKDDYKVTEGTLAQPTGSDILSGAKNIALITANSTKELPAGSEIKSSVAVGLMDGISKGVPSIMENVNKIATNADTLMLNLKGVVTDNTGKHVEQILASIELAMKQIEVLSHTLSAQTANINSLMTNASSTMNNFNKLSTGIVKDGKINNILSNAENATQQLSQAKIEQTINNLEATTQKLNGLMAKLENDKGTLGAIINDPKLYNNLNKTVEDLGNLSEDLKNHPGKYINISIFPSKARKN